MAVELFDLVPSLNREINPPGVVVLEDEDELAEYLADAFWEARLDGLLAGYTVNDDLQIETTGGGDDMPRELQQLIVFYSGLRIIRNAMRDTSTSFRAKAGPVEYEKQNSAQLLRDLFAELRAKRDWLIGQLSDLGLIPYTYIDMVAQREASIGYGDVSFVSGVRSRGYGGY